MIKIPGHAARDITHMHSGRSFLMPSPSMKKGWVQSGGALAARGAASTAGVAARGCRLETGLSGRG